MTKKLATLAALSLALGACGDRTVTSTPKRSDGSDGSPAVTVSSPAMTTADGSPAARPATVQVADRDLAEIDRMLNEIQSEVGNADREATTPEGDPTS